METKIVNYHFDPCYCNTDFALQQILVENQTSSNLKSFNPDFSNNSAVGTFKKVYMASDYENMV